jgi:hypothetical protein
MRNIYLVTHKTSVPLGDSITEITCWRAYVWDDLVAANVSSQVQYVGSQNSNPQNCRPKTSNVSPFIIPRCGRAYFMGSRLADFAGDSGISTTKVTLAGWPSTLLIATSQTGSRAPQPTLSCLC